MLIKLHLFDQKYRKKYILKYYIPFKKKIVFSKDMLNKYIYIVKNYIVRKEFHSFNAVLFKLFINQRIQKNITASKINKEN